MVKALKDDIETRVCVFKCSDGTVTGNPDGELRSLKRIRIREAVG